MLVRYRDAAPPDLYHLIREERAHTDAHHGPGKRSVPIHQPKIIKIPLAKLREGETAVVIGPVHLKVFVEKRRSKS